MVNDDLEFLQQIQNGESDAWIGVSGMLRGKPNFSVDIRLDESGEWLLWKQWDHKTNSKPKTINFDGMLDRFIKLVTAEDVLKFAKRYGPLGICHHGLPSSHNSPPPVDIYGMGSKIPITGREESGIASSTPFLDFIERNFPSSSSENEDNPSVRLDIGLPSHYCLPLTWDSQSPAPRGRVNQTTRNSFFSFIHMDSKQLCEPIEVWFKLIEMVRSVMRVTNSLNQGQPQRFEDLQRLNMPDFLDPKLANLWVSDVVNFWLNIGGVRPSIFKTDRPTSSISWDSSVFGAIAVQTMGFFRNSRNSAICMECQDIYFPSKAPKKNHPNYCKKDSCRRAAAKYRQRKKRNDPSGKK